MKNKKSLSESRRFKSRAFFRSIFDYKDGVLYWRPRPISHFGNKQSYMRWNNRYVGKRAGSLSYGYYKVAVFQKCLAVHRIVFLYHKGYLPPEIDHINGDKLDNRIENLRASDKVTNKWNAKISKDNKTGVKGVFKRNGYYEAYICARGKRYYLGCYKKKSDAVRIVCDKRKALHGEFARAS